MLVYSVLKAIVNFIIFFSGRVKIIGREKIPTTGPYIIVVNHMSKADPPLVLIALPDGVQMRYFAAEKWKKHLVFGPLLRWGGGIFVNRGEVDRRALRQATSALRNGTVFGIAPEGTRSRVGALIEARDGAAYLATRARAPILPIGIINTDILGHNMAHFRKTDIEIRVGEMFELPHMGHRPKGPELAAYTHLIMIHIATLLPRRYWGYYADSPALAALISGEDPWPYCLELAKVSPDFS